VRLAGGTQPWLGRPRPWSRSASAWKSTAIFRPRSDFTFRRVRSSGRLAWGATWAARADGVLGGRGCDPPPPVRPGNPAAGVPPRHLGAMEALRRYPALRVTLSEPR